MILILLMIGLAEPTGYPRRLGARSRSGAGALKGTPPGARELLK
jgi:hypothetical protein